MISPPVLPDAPGLPVLPLRQAVFLPGRRVWLRLHRPASLHAIETALARGGELALFTERYDRPPPRPGRPDDLCQTGVGARVERVVRGPGAWDVWLDIVRRIRAVRWRGPDLSVTVAPLTEAPPATTGAYWDGALAELRRVGHRLSAAPERRRPVALPEAPGELADVVAGLLPLSLGVQQDLLEETDLGRRVRAVLGHARDTLANQRLRFRFRREFAAHLEGERRAAYLQGQLRYIRHQLGEDRSEGARLADRLSRRLAAAGLPAELRRELAPELRRLSHLEPADTEFPALTDYLRTVAELPWAIAPRPPVPLTRVRAALAGELYATEAVKQRLLEHLATRRRNPGGRFPVLCVWGPPGVGKRALARTMARVLGRKLIRLRLAGIQDETEIVGDRRTRAGTTLGRPLDEIRKAGVRDPLVLLEGVDRLGFDCQGDPAGALLQVLDPELNPRFTDRYLDLPFDLSEVLFVATANHADDIPLALRERLELVRMSGYSDADKLAIAQRYLVPRQLAEHRLEARCRFTADALHLLIHAYTREAGVRALDRCLGALCRHAVAQLDPRDDDREVCVTVETVGRVLGPPRYLRETKLEAAGTGVATGLAWTSVGGEIMHIEALRYPGNGQILLTGQIGSVMKESAQAALSLLKSRATALGIESGTILGNDLHVHVPAGAVPKDGPSAGISIFTAITSLWTGRAIRPDVAMTGEITLRGVVLPVGGLREKILAAQRAGIFTVIFPAANQGDLGELPASVRRRMHFVPVATVDQALAAALAAKRPAGKSPKAA